MNHSLNNSWQTLPNDYTVFHQAVRDLVAIQFNPNAPPPTMRHKLKRTGIVEGFCDKRIRKAREAEVGKLTVGKRGKITDDNGRRVEAFAFGIGRFVVGQTLYTGLAVDMLSEEVHLLLIRSDVTTALHTLFPDIGTVQDWRILQKCIERFSPKVSSHRCVIDLQTAQHSAAETAAANYLEQSGTFQQNDLNILQDMDTAKLHMMDLCSIIALATTFQDNLVPRLIHVLVTKSHKDFEEVHRVLRACNFSVGIQSPSLDVPSIDVKGKSTLDIWRKSARFAYIRYNKSQDIDFLFASVSQALALDDTQFHKQFPYPPVVAGSNIWSDRTCVEIDMRGLRFSNEELLVGRKYVASLLKNHHLLMSKFAETWHQSITSYDAAVTPYPQLWFHSFHFAAGMTLFPASNALMDYMNLTRDADASRLRLQTDRSKRYADAIKKLKDATEAEPWVYGSKPHIKAEALALLEKRYDAFLHQKDGKPVFAFTEASLIRCASLEQSEVNDFVSKLKENHLLSNKTYPVTFSKGEQFRFICINAEAITVTAANGKGEMI